MGEKSQKNGPSAEKWLDRKSNRSRQRKQSGEIWGEMGRRCGGRTEEWAIDGGRGGVSRVSWEESWVRVEIQ